MGIQNSLQKVSFVIGNRKTSFDIIWGSIVGVEILAGSHFPIVLSAIAGPFLVKSLMRGITQCWIANQLA